MRRIWILPLAAATLAATACVGYGYPGAGSGYGGGPSGRYGAPAGTYPPPQGYPTYPPAGYGATVRCESNDGRTRYCAADTRGGVRLSRRLSRTECDLGRNWGYDARGIWVSQGCRAEFMTGAGIGAPGYGMPGAGQTVRCESNDGRLRHCPVAVRRGVHLSRQLSHTTCVLGRNWGWDRGGIWVNGGCRAEFSVD